MMTNPLLPYAGALYAVLRLVAGGLFACHGAQKLLGAFGGDRETEGLMLFAGAIELIGGLLIAVGLVAPLAAFFASGQMAVAYFMAHAPNGPWPIENGGELAVLYCFLFLYVAARGAGRYSVDAYLWRGKPVAQKRR